MNTDLDKLRRSGLISATARETCKKLIKPGVRLEKIHGALDWGFRKMFGQKRTCLSGVPTG